MRFLNWKTGLWFLIVGLIGTLMPMFSDYGLSIGGLLLPGWLFYIFLGIGAVIVIIGIVVAAKNKN